MSGLKVIKKTKDLYIAVMSSLIRKFLLVFSSLIYCEALPSFRSKKDSILSLLNNTHPELATEDVKSNEEFVEEYGFFTTRWLYGIGLALLQIDAICILYVIYRTFKRWRRTNTSLSMAHKLPFYMASLDFFIYIFQTTNLLYPAIYIHNWPEPQCSLIAGCFFFVAITNILLVGISSVMSWLIVCRRVDLSLGKYDWKMFVVPFGGATVLTALSARTFGNDEFWCYTSDQHTIVPKILLVVDFCVLSTTLFCYINILREISSTEFDHTNGPFLKASKKVLGYLLMYFVQWTPLMVYVIADILNYEQIWLYFLTVSFIAAGGILNMVQYIVNEGWKDKPKFPVTNQDSGNAPNSIKSTEIEGRNRGWNHVLRKSNFDEQRKIVLKDG